MTEGSEVARLDGQPGLALEGRIIQPGAARRIDPAMAATLAHHARPKARMGIGGPLDGKVLASSSSRLDYRKPTLTVMLDLETGHANPSIDAEPLFTYVPQEIQVLGVRRYRIWVGEGWWEDLQTPTENRPYPMEEFEEEVLLRLIDASPADCRACQALP